MPCRRSHIPIIHLEIVGRGNRALPSRPRWRCGATRAPGSKTSPRRWRTSAKAARAARADYVGEIPARMKAWAADAAPRLNSRDRPIHMARLCTELNRALPAEFDPRRRWRVCRALDRAPLRHQAAGAPFHPRSRARLDRLRAAGRHRRGDGGAGPPVVAITGDGGFNMMLGELETARRAGLGLTDRRRQQRRLGLCEGAAARDDGRALPVRRPRRDGLRRDRPRDGRRRHPGRGPRGARRRRSRRAWPNATARPSSMSSSPATPARCSPPSTTARSRSNRATG